MLPDTRSRFSPTEAAADVWGIPRSHIFLGNNWPGRGKFGKSLLVNEGRVLEFTLEASRNYSVIKVTDPC